MTTDKPLTFVPKLRFPEFRDGPRWDLRTLSSASDVNPPNNGLPDSFVYIDLQSVKSSMLIERKHITRNAAPSRAQRLLSRKDIIYQTVRPYQRNNFFFDICDEHEYVASTGYAQLRASECPEFLYQLLHTDSFVNSVLARCTGSNYPAINPSDLASICVVLPRNPEQQKIADCLGSLDALLVAEGRKIDALRQHKQGLIQRLFPQPGETVPRLRFPEFHDGGEWDTRKLGDFVSRNKETFDPQKSRDTPHLIELENIESKTGRILGVAELEKHNSLKSTFQAGDVLFGKLRPYLQKFARPNFHGVCTQEIWVLRSKETSRAFLYYLIQTERFIQLVNVSSGSRMPRADWNFLADAVFEIPHPDEQEKISGCLGSLDDLIAVEDRKLEALRQHKKGMMQQLFPSLKDSEQ